MNEKTLALVGHLNLGNYQKDGQVVCFQCGKGIRDDQEKVLSLKFLWHQKCLHQFQHPPLRLVVQ